MALITLLYFIFKVFHFWITSKMIYHQQASMSIADLMFCHGTQTMGNSRICHRLLFHEHGKQKFM